MISSALFNPPSTSTPPFSSESGSRSSSGVPSSSTGSSTSSCWCRRCSTARLRRCSSITARVSSEYEPLHLFPPSASLGERYARFGEGKGADGRGGGSAEEDTSWFPFAPQSFSISLPTAVTSTGGGTSDGTGLRRAIAVPVAVAVASPLMRVGGEDPPDAPGADPTISCDRPASRIRFSLLLGTASMLEGDTAGSEMGESPTADDPADMGGVLTPLEERSWRDRPPRGYCCAKGLLLDSTRDWRWASSVDEVYTVCTGCSENVSVYGGFQTRAKENKKKEDTLSGKSAMEISCTTVVVAVARTSRTGTSVGRTPWAPFMAVVDERRRRHGEGRTGRQEPRNRKGLSGAYLRF